MEISKEQKEKIEQNRRKALELRASKLLNKNNCKTNNGSTVSVVKNNFPNTSKITGPIASKPNNENTLVKYLNKANDGILNNNKNIDNKNKVSDFAKTFKKVDAKCVLISPERFIIEATYFAPLIELFKTAKSKQYDAQSRNWSFSLNEYQKIRTDIQLKQKEVVKLQELPNIILKAFGHKIFSSSNNNNIKNNNNDNAPIDLSEVDDELKNSLLPFQKEGVEFCIRKGGRMLIADDMGLGKTLQAICVARYYMKDWPLLVMCPSSVKHSWKQQLLRWLPSTLNGCDISVLEKCVDSHWQDANVVIIGYDLLTKMHAKLIKRNFNVVISDESHCLKNCKTARTKCALPILKQSKRALLLSGTPALSRPSELFSQLSAVDPITFSNFMEYGLRYCNGKECPWGWDFSGSSNLTELKLLMEEKYMIRRMKSLVLSQLPSKYRTVVMLGEGSVKINRQMKEAKNTMDKSKRVVRENLLDFFHQTAEAKIKAVCDYTLDLLESGKRFLIFAHHQNMLDALEGVAKKNSYDYIRIDGKTKAEQRNYFCKKFQTNPDVKIAVLSILAANAGINLSSASLVVFAELFWNPGILVQAEDRVHRIGQENSVTIQYLAAKNTSDDYVWVMVKNKLELLSKAGLSNGNFSKADTTHSKTSMKTLDSYWDKDQKNFPNDNDLIDNDLMLGMDNFDKIDIYTENNSNSEENDYTQRNNSANHSKNSVWSDADDNLLNEFSDSFANDCSDNIAHDYIGSKNLKKARFN